jgi:hypothetical protein
VLQGQRVRYQVVSGRVRFSIGTAVTMEQEKQAVDYIMGKVYEYGIACVNLHIRGREGYAGLGDEHKHQQFLWKSIHDMIDNEVTMLMDSCTEHSEKAEAWRKMYQSMFDIHHKR